jgi:type VI secretion system protein ImpK
MKLVDYFIPLTALVKGFDASSGLAPQDLATQIDSLVQQAQTQALNNGVDLEQFQRALFPVLSWADEHISRRHSWESEHAWQKHLLQRRYFKTGLAGREFFDRLQALSDDDTAVREVYLLCLCLGFMGRYSISPNSAELAGIRLEQYNKLQSADPSYASAEKEALFPKAYAMSTSSPGGPSGNTRAKAPRRFTLRRIMLFVLPPVIVLLVAAGLHAQLTYAVQHFRDAVNL